jgi:hypothetical protein
MRRLIGNFASRGLRATTLTLPRARLRIGPATGLIGPIIGPIISKSRIKFSTSVSDIPGPSVSTIKDDKDNKDAKGTKDSKGTSDHSHKVGTSTRAQVILASPLPTPKWPTQMLCRYDWGATPMGRYQISNYNHPNNGLLHKWDLYNGDIPKSIILAEVNAECGKTVFVGPPPLAWLQWSTRSNYGPWKIVVQAAPGKWVSGHPITFTSGGDDDDQLDQLLWVIFVTSCLAIGIYAATRPRYIPYDDLSDFIEAYPATNHGVSTDHVAKITHEPLPEYAHPGSHIELYDGKQPYYSRVNP